MTPELLTFRHLADDILLAPPRCTLVAVPDLLRLVDTRCADPRPPHLIVDLSDVVEWDMTVLTPMAWARRRCRSRGGELTLVLPSRPVFSANEIAVLKQLFTLAEDLPTAKLSRIATTATPQQRSAVPVGHA